MKFYKFYLGKVGMQFLISVIMTLSNIRREVVLVNFEFLIMNYSVEHYYLSSIIKLVLYSQMSSSIFIYS